MFKLEMIYLQKPSQSFYAYCFISEDSKHFLIRLDILSRLQDPPPRLADASVKNAKKACH